MSQPTTNKVPARRVSADAPADRPAARSGNARPQSSGGGRSNESRPYSGSGGGNRSGAQRPRSVEYARRDPFPYVMGGVIGALVVGLMLMVFLISSNGNSTNSSGVNPPAGGVAGVTTLPNAANDKPVATVANPAGGSAVEPTRMSMDDFMKLYNDPAKRPLIVDVRAKAAFGEGHIAGAVNIPDAETVSRLSEFPKDKLVVAYCQ